MSDDLKRSGGFIPGVRLGWRLQTFFDKVMSLDNLPRIFISSSDSCVPAIIVSLMDVFNSLAMFLGTSLILWLVSQ
jgi:preprotein translocase subunit SecY